MKKLLTTAFLFALIAIAIPSISFGQAAIAVEPALIVSPEVGEEFEVSITIKGGENVAAYQFTLTFDPTAIEYVSLTNADYLPAGAFATTPKIVEGNVANFGAVSLAGASNGDGTLARAVFKVLEKKDSTIGLLTNKDLGFLVVELSDPDTNKLPLTTEDARIVKEIVELDQVITEHTDGATALTFSGVLTEADGPVKLLVTVWASADGFVPVPGTFIEYQVNFPEIGVHKSGGLYAHTDDGETTPLIGNAQGMRTQAASGWTHRKVDLTPIAGKKVTTLTAGTIADSAPAGLFSMMLDNIQVTDGTNVFEKIWLSSENGDEPVETITFGDLVGADQVLAEAGEDVIAVEPKDKLVTTWGKLKSSK